MMGGKTARNMYSADNNDAQWEPEIDHVWFLNSETAPAVSDVDFSSPK
jgi:hypothetical protein